MLTHAQASLYHGTRRIVRHAETGALIGVALEACVAVGPPTHIWLHGDPRQVYRFLPRTGKVVGMPWIATPATDAEVEDVLAAMEPRGS